MDAMPGHENFMWFIADQEKILSRTDADGNPTKKRGNGNACRLQRRYEKSGL